MKFSKKVLSNGIRLLIVPMKDHPTVTVEVLVEAGSKYETKQINGISHFLEHMCFKGTQKRPSAFHVTRDLDAVGAQFNAFTGQEFTGYYAKCATRHFDRALDVVSDIYLNSTLPAAEAEREKGVVIEEINMYEDLPRQKVQELFAELLYGDTPAGWAITGSKETVSALTREQLLEYRRRQYVADATVIVVAGDVDEKLVTEKIEQIFSNAHRGAKDGKEKVIDRQTAPAVQVSFKETDQAHFVLGVRTFDVHDPRNPILRVLSGVLGGGMSSRLFQKVREELGAAYYVGAGNEPFTDHGYFEIAAGVDQKRVTEVMSAVLAECVRLKTEMVSTEELARVKDQLIGNMYLSLETSDAVADVFGYQEIMHRPIQTPDQVQEKIRAVQAEDIQKLARELFVNQNLNFSLIGKFKESESFLKVLSFGA
ncbi:MAG: hypothetical protein A2664_04575 [Candidatus Taylorbacteria bacterium RIFCSPHIGHO2_01_FULL_46_22b]|uniref:Peptidase M16 n=1 Tax=Candidatus Taylorbacteria bacterium RIFCSPHIGHO2_01_FULL_46_22b TaxID=1802301 RepID=A0A1G2M4L7_9BACT|nr:MAG: hypothetical protein A2664_04575 [Candidatus Taylorbacteria bacterium RIFCSPHIGHO2_01_FULL_46_22b]